MKWTILLSLGLVPAIALSQTFQVKKVKGKTALIEVTSGQLKEGGRYLIQDLASSPSNSEGHRNMLIGLEGSFLSLSSLTSDTGGSGSQATTTDLETTFGWNFNRFETGPLLSLTSSSGSSQSSQFALGGFFDYNLQENISPASRVYGGLFSFQMTNLEAGGARSSGQKISIGAFFKWFPGPDWLCLRTQLKYLYAENKNDLVTTKITGFVITTGVTTYF